MIMLSPTALSYVITFTICRQFNGIKTDASAKVRTKFDVNRLLRE